MRKVLVLSVLISCLAAKAQSGKKLKYVTISPAFINYYMASPQLGIGVDLNRRWSVMGEFAYGAHSGNWGGMQDIKLYRISGELKGFTQPAPRNVYVSIQSAYVQRNFHIENGTFITREGKHFNYKQADIHSPSFSYALKMGLEKQLRRGLFLDFSIGAGGRFIFTRVNATNAKEVITGDQNNYSCLSLWRPEDYTYTYPKHVFNLPVSFRLGYRFH